MATVLNNRNIGHNSHWKKKSFGQGDLKENILPFLDNFPSLISYDFKNSRGPTMGKTWQKKKKYCAWQNMTLVPFRDRERNNI